jgi:hypothetical protein
MIIEIVETTILDDSDQLRVDPNRKSEDYSAAFLVHTPSRE